MPRASLLSRIDANASRRRETSFAYKVAIGARFFLVLDDQIGEFADRARAEADEDGGVILGKSLKIAVHPPLARRDRKRIIVTREMVEAARNIAGVGQAAIAEFGLLEAPPLVSQPARVDPPHPPHPLLPGVLDE